MITRNTLTFILLFSSFTCSFAGSKEYTSSKSEREHNPAIEELVLVSPDAGKKWNIFGIQIVGKIFSTQTNGSYSVIASTTPPNGGPPFHVHENEDELFFVIEGKFEFRCGARTIVAPKGTLVHLPKNIPHRFTNIGDSNGMLLNTITPGGFEQFFEEIDRLPKDKALDRKIVQTIAKKYGVTFLPKDDE